MKKTRIFIGTATFVLAIVAFMATKANNKKFSSFTTAVTLGGNVKVLGSFTTTVNTHQFYVTTALNQVFVTLYTAVSKNLKAYAK